MCALFKTPKIKPVKATPEELAANTAPRPVPTLQRLGRPVGFDKRRFEASMRLARKLGEFSITPFDLPK